MADTKTHKCCPKGVHGSFDLEPCPSCEACAPSHSMPGSCLLSTALMVAAVAAVSGVLRGGKRR